MQCVKNICVRQKEYGWRTWQSAYTCLTCRAGWPARSSHDSRVGFLDYLVDHDRDPSTTHATCNVGQARASACVVPSLESLSSLISACRVACSMKWCRDQITDCQLPRSASHYYLLPRQPHPCHACAGSDSAVGAPA